jgi:thiol-disulfide isomerase/thioredoxin
MKSIKTKIMKKIILTLSILLLISLSFAQGIEFFHGTFEEAKTEAKAQGKLIFMDAYAVWCGPCKMMTNNVFPQQEVGDFFNANFINLKVDMEKGEGLDIRRQYGVSAYPTLLLIDAQGAVVQEIKGARNAEGLISWAKTAAVPNTELSDKMQTKYDEGDRSPSLMRSLIKVKAAFNEDYKVLFTEYLNGLSEEQKLEKENANFIFDQTSDIYSPGLDFFKSYGDYLKETKGEEVYQNKLMGFAKNSAQVAVEVNDVALLNEAIAFMKSYKLKNAPQIGSEMKLGFYATQNDWNSYDKEVTKYLAKYKKGDDKAYREVSWNYYMKIDDEKKLNKAEKWMQSSIKANNTYENNLTQAYLLYKLKDYSEAEDAVNYALILAGDEKKTDNAQILKDQILKKLNKIEMTE